MRAVAPRPRNRAERAGRLLRPGLVGAVVMLTMASAVGAAAPEVRPHVAHARAEGNGATATLMSPVPSLAAAAADPQLSLTRFDHDLTIRPGRTASVSPFCRRGFALVSTSFNLISTNPSGPGNEPIVVLRSLVPQPKGSTFTFENIGTITVTMRTSAHCARITVPPAGSSGAHGGPQPGNDPTGGQKRARAKLVSRIVSAKKRVSAGARAGKVVTVSARCTLRNSIPGDIGFESERAEFVGIRFFKRGGDIGAKLRFRVEGEDRITAYLVCVQGKGVQMKGEIARARAARASERRAGSAAMEPRKPGIVVRYFSSSWVGHPDVPFPGVTTFADTESRTFWMNGVPADVPEGSHWMSRDFVGPGGLPGSASVRASGGSPGPAAGAVGGEQTGVIALEKLPVLKRLFRAQGAELRTSRLTIDDDRTNGGNSRRWNFGDRESGAQEIDRQTFLNGGRFEGRRNQERVASASGTRFGMDRITVFLAASEPSTKRIIAREVTELDDESSPSPSAFGARRAFMRQAIEIEDFPDGRGFSFTPTSNQIEVKFATNEPHPTRLVVTVENGDEEVERTVLDFGDDPLPEGPRCSNGADDDFDGLEDKKDPGCLSKFVGPDDPLAYNRNDESENHFAIPLNCAQAGGNVNTVIHGGVTLEAHMLVDDATGKALLRRTSADGDFLEGGPVAIGVCKNTTLSWEINNRSVRYRISVGAGGSGNATVLNVADTSGD